VLGLSLELGLEVLEKGVVEVLTTEMGVSSGGLDGENLTLDGKKRDIESSTSEIEDEDGSLVGGLLVETVSNGGSGGLVDDSENLESGDGTGILGSETLGVVEVSGDGDDSLLDGLAELGLGDLLHLGEDHGGDFLWREGLLLVQVVNLNEWGSVLVDNGEWPVLHVLLDIWVIETSTNESLGVEDGVSGVHGGLVLGGISDQSLTLGESDVRRGGSVTLVVGNDFNPVLPEDGNTRVGGSEIDSDGSDHFDRDFVW